MKTISQVLSQALLSLQEKYHQSEKVMREGEDTAPPGVKSPASPSSQTEAQRKVLRRFLHFRR